MTQSSEELISKNFMNLSAICELHLATIVEQLAPWSELQVDRDWVYYNRKLLHCTLAVESTPDPRYWTAYDRFIAWMEARREARRHARRRTMRALRRLTARWARAVRGRPTPRAQRAAA